MGFRSLFKGKEEARKEEVRKGDLVRVRGLSAYGISRFRWVMVDAGDGEFPAVKGCFSLIVPEGTGHVVHLEDIIKVFPREKVKKYWEYI